MSRFTEVGEPEPVERTRRLLAIGLLGILFAVLGVAGWSAFVEYAELETVVAGLVTPVVGLVGSVIGYYFGSRIE